MGFFGLGFRLGRLWVQGLGRWFEVLGLGWCWGLEFRILGFGGLGGFGFKVAVLWFRAVGFTTD